MGEWMAFVGGLVSANPKIDRGYAMERRYREGSSRAPFSRAMVALDAKALKDAEFEESVLNADVPVLVDFYAKWCGPCKMVSPLVDWAGSEYGEKRLRVYKLDIDKDQEYLERFNVHALPHLVLFDGGEDKMHLTGLVKKSELIARLNEHIPESA